ncbi:MAG TPA: acyl-CoA dehydrogenase, partial [Polyangiaceae bacterium]|nr:acyl-CoA dehydrogenase [Polyangiaceae bacterium]
IVVPRDTAGLSVRPIGGLLGCRASMLAEVVFEGCRVPESNLLARPGFGVSHVAQSALDVGRLSIAWGSLGLHRACLEASVGYVRERKQFGVPIAEHALVRRLITNMYAEFTASRLICLEAAQKREKAANDALTSVMLAKYYASTAAMRAASDAVQLHGANGCHVEFGVERLFRDAKVAEIIEGSSQIQQLVIGKHVAQALDLDLKVGKSL